MAKNDDTTIDIPPAEDATISGATFTFDVSSACTVCFGTADPEGSFPESRGSDIRMDSRVHSSIPGAA